MNDDLRYYGNPMNWESTKGDFISREALKEKAETVTLWNGDVRRFVSYETIDNAPTVEIPENEVNCVLTMFGKCSYNETGCSDCEIKDKIRKALNDRTQGEWAEFEGGYRCSNCDDIEVYTPNFCPNCGADMRKGGAE